MRVLPASLLISTLACSAAFAGVTRGPYPQNVDLDSATVAFRLDASCPATVRYGTGGQTNLAAPSHGNGTEHFVKLEGLTPGAQYTYSIEACGADQQKTGSFETAPVQGTQSVHFAAMGDMGTGGTTQKQVAEAMQNARPDFWLALGDNAYEAGTDAEFQTRFFEAMPGLLANSIVFPVIGNHEYVTAQGQPYFDAFELPTNNPAKTEHYYSFDWGFVHIAALDTNVALDEQRAWLEQDLANSKAPWKIVMFHHPVYSSGEHGSTARSQELIPVLEAGGVDLVLTGHDHDYERTYPMKGGQVVPAGTPGAITYVVAGTGGATNRPFTTGAPEWSAFRSDNAYGYLDVKIEGGALQAKLIAPDGSALDSFTLTKDVPPPPSGTAGAPGAPGSPGATGGDGAEGAGCASGGMASVVSPLAAIAALAAVSIARRRRAAR